MLNALDLGRLGYVVVGLFAATWLCSVTLWKTRRFEQRWSARLERT
jgi:high-affinity nickel-transport protein